MAYLIYVPFVYIIFALFPILFTLLVTIFSYTANINFFIVCTQSSSFIVLVLDLPSSHCPILHPEYNSFLMSLIAVVTLNPIIPSYVSIVSPKQIQLIK